MQSFAIVHRCDHFRQVAKFTFSEPLAMCLEPLAVFPMTHSTQTHFKLPRFLSSLVCWSPLSSTHFHKMSWGFVAGRQGGDKMTCLRCECEE